MHETSFMCDTSFTHNTSLHTQVIAERLQESKQQVPHYYLTVDVRMDTLLKVHTMSNNKRMNNRLPATPFGLLFVVCIGRVC